MNAWHTTMKAPDGSMHDVRLLLDIVELEYLQAVGIVSEALEIVGLQQVADGVVGMLEKSEHEYSGGVVQ